MRKKSAVLFVTIVLSLFVFPVSAYADTTYYFDNHGVYMHFSDDWEVVTNEGYYQGWDNTVNLSDDDFEYAFEDLNCQLYAYNETLGMNFNAIYSDAEVYNGFSDISLAEELKDDLNEESGFTGDEAYRVEQRGGYNYISRYYEMNDSYQVQYQTTGGDRLYTFTFTIFGDDFDTIGDEIENILNSVDIKAVGTDEPEDMKDGTKHVDWKNVGYDALVMGGVVLIGGIICGIIGMLRRGKKKNDNPVAKSSNDKPLEQIQNVEVQKTESSEETNVATNQNTNENVNRFIAQGLVGKLRNGEINAEEFNEYMIRLTADGRDAHNEYELLTTINVLNYWNID